MMLRRIAIASLALGSPGFVASIVQSQLVQACALIGRIVPQNGHSIVSKVIGFGCGGASVYSIAELIRNSTSQELPDSSSIPCHCSLRLGMCGDSQCRLFLKLSITRTIFSASTRSKTGQMR